MAALVVPRPSSTVCKEQVWCWLLLDRGVEEGAY